MDSLVAQIMENFKAAYGLKITDSDDLFLTERNLLEFLMKLGRQAMGEVFRGIGNGYEGSVMRKEGRKYRFVGYRTTSLHGLFGMIEYKRAYYFNAEKGGGGCFPLDAKLGIQKRHTPGCQYFLTSFTGREAYEKSLARFHEIFRPDGTELISLRKSLDMDAQLGKRLRGLRQEEIIQVFDNRQVVHKENPIAGVMAVSVDATKLRERGEEERTVDGKRHFRRWKTMLFEGKVEKFLQELRSRRDAPDYRAHRDFLQGEINYFAQNKERMKYDTYRALHLPIGSGTIESACKNVIGGRMKQGGMSWSEAGANGMLQIRCSIASGRLLPDFLATLDRAA